VLFAVLVACVSATALALGATRLRAVAKLMPSSPSALRAALRARDQQAVQGAVQGLFAAQDFDHDILTRALLDGTSADAAVAALNEHLGDVARGLSVGSTVPRAMGRVALAAGTLAAVLQLGGSVSTAAGAEWAPAAWQFLAGCVGAGAAFEMDRRCGALSERVRRGWDEVAALCERWLRSPGAARQE
jgi:hypothetical protein